MDSVVTEYFAGWPKASSQYVKDLIWGQSVGIKYIDSIKNKSSTKPRCVVFDFDDCLVFGDPAECVGVKEMELGIHDGNEIFILPPNEPIVKLAEYAKRAGFLVIILTARPKESREATIWNCKYFNIPYDILIMNDSDDDPCFKINVRRRIANKYNVVLTVGDQITDCMCPGEGTAFIKLPDPGIYDKVNREWKDHSLVTYCWIPPM